MGSVLESDLLGGHGFRHGFTLRGGGISTPPFDDLNLGREVGDAPANVEENHRRLALALGYLPEDLFEVAQVHGSDVHVVQPGEAPVRVRQLPGDALVAGGDGVAVGVRVADCAPVLLADPRTGAVAAVHAGWRGTVARVLDAAIASLARHCGSRPRELLAAIGPHIRVGAFEVGDDVAEAIAAQAHGLDVVQRGGPRPHVDLALTIRAQLRHAGVVEDHIDDVGGCTWTEPGRFFSYRRDGARSGRHMAVIVAGGA